MPIRRKHRPGSPWLWVICAAVVCSPFLFCCILPALLGLLQSNDRRPLASFAERQPTHAAAPDPRLEATPVKIDIVPFRTAQGRDTVQIKISLRNTGNRAIRKVLASITCFDANGLAIQEASAKRWVIYGVSNDSPGLLPGEVYTPPIDEGFVFPQLLVRRFSNGQVKVKVVEVSEKGFDF